LNVQLWHVFASASELSEVFNNLILNARQAMRDSGTLSISAENVTIDPSVDGELTPGDYAVIRFQDTGPGVDPAIRQRVFEPFFTTKPEGTGLGLAMSHAIIRDHGGRIAVTAAPGGGAAFEVWLPALRDKDASIIPQATHDTSLGSGRILLLDDDAAIRLLATRVLEKRGYQVAAASTGEEIIELYRNAKELGQPFDLVILDLTVPGAMGGEPTFAALREIDSGVVALASSGYSDDATISRLTGLGFVGMLAKPYLAHELRSTVKAAIS
jgi:CheY-like chemotaxis protein